MSRILISVLLLIGLSFGGKTDSLKIIALSAKVDSLSQVLKDAKMAASYAEKTLDVTKELGKNANSNLWIQFGIFVGAVISVFVAAAAILGLWVRSRTNSEQETIAIQVRELVTPGLMALLEEQRIDIRRLSTDHQALNKNYSHFAGEAEQGISNLQSEITTEKNKTMTLEVEAKLIDRRVEKLEFFNLVNEFSSNMQEVEKFLENKNLASAARKAIECVKSYPAPGEHQLIYKRYSIKLLNIVQAATKIRQETKELIEGIYSCLLDFDKGNLEQAVNALPIYQRQEPTTISEALLGETIPEGVI